MQCILGGLSPWLVIPKLWLALQHCWDQEMVAPVEGKTNREAIKQSKYCEVGLVNQTGPWILILEEWRSKVMGCSSQVFSSYILLAACKCMETRGGARIGDIYKFILKPSATVSVNIWSLYLKSCVCFSLDFIVQRLNTEQSKVQQVREVYSVQRVFMINWQ